MQNENWLIEQIEAYVANYPKEQGTQTRWQTPLLATVAATDPRLTEIKKQVGPKHLLPQDLLPGARSVICYFLPFAPEIGRSNQAEAQCSDEWAWAYVETNQLINDLNRYLQEELGKRGYIAAVTPATHNFDEQTLLSNWSHRHLAVLAGLGSIGLNQMLITDKGCCGRLGSLVSDLELNIQPPALSPACLYYFDQSCRQCIIRCPTGALTESSFDRFKCYAHLLQNVELHQPKGYVDACGKCVSRIPCAFVNPVKKRQTSLNKETKPKELIKL